MDNSANLTLLKKIQSSIQPKFVKAFLIWILVSESYRNNHETSPDDGKSSQLENDCQRRNKNADCKFLQKLNECNNESCDENHEQQSRSLEMGDVIV